MFNITREPVTLKNIILISKNSLGTYSKYNRRTKLKTEFLHICIHNEDISEETQTRIAAAIHRYNNQAIIKVILDEWLSNVNHQNDLFSFTNNWEVLSYEEVYEE